LFDLSWLRWVFSPAVAQPLLAALFLLTFFLRSQEWLRYIDETAATVAAAEKIPGAQGRAGTSATAQK